MSYSKLNQRFIDNTNTATFKYKDSVYFDYSIQQQLKDYVIYINNNSDTEFTKYIKDNYEKIKSEFHKKDKTFVILPKQDYNNNLNNDLYEAISYLYPSIDIEKYITVLNQYLRQIYGKFGKRNKD